MYSFLVENGDFFPIWLTEYTYSVKAVTVIASFQKRSPKWRFFKTLAVYVWTDENGTCRIRDAVQYIIYYQHDACSVSDAISTHFPIVKRFRMDGRKRFEYATRERIHIWKQGKTSPFLKIFGYVWHVDQFERLFGCCTFFLSIEMTAWICEV